MNTDLIKVPNPFCMKPFYTKGDQIQLPMDSLKLKNSWGKIYFAHDIAYYKKILKGTSPWDNPKAIIKEGLVLWKNEGIPLLKDFFKKRDRNSARPILIKYLSIYIQMMIWLQGRPVQTIESISKVLQIQPYAPFNVEERLQFIIDNPDHHHAFTTLIQLFEESEKKWAIYLLKQKK